jgi:hypothetical protein
LLRWLARWVRATFEFNPTFPLSACFLLAGLKLLAKGSLDTASATPTLAGLSILEGYELCLLLAALAVLWPRKIVYETTSILIIFGVVRFAAPFVVIGFAVEGHPHEAALLGAVVAALMIAKTEVLSRRILPASKGERLYDHALFTLASVGLPLLAHGLAQGSASTFSYDTARLLQLAAWWGLALLLAPIAVGAPVPGPASPLYVPSPTAVFSAWAVRRTGSAIVGLPFLLGSALWLGGNEPVLAFLLPVALVVAGVVGAMARAAGYATPRFLAYVPAAAGAFVLACPRELLLGRSEFISHEACALAFLPLAAAAVPLVARGHERRAWRGLAVVVGAAPLRFVATLEAGELYLLVLTGLVLAAGLVRRRDAVVAAASLPFALLATNLAWQGDHALESQLLFAFTGTLAVLVAWRLPRFELASGVAVLLGAVATGSECIHGVPEDRTLVIALAATGALALLGWRQDSLRVVKGAAAGSALLVGRRYAHEIEPGVVLVGLAFASIGAGTAIAVRRERRIAERALRAAALRASVEEFLPGAVDPAEGAVPEPEFVP